MEQILIDSAIIGASIILYLILVKAAKKWLGGHGTMVVAAPVLMLALLLLSSCGGNPEDHTGENWLLLIGLMLCWLKG